ncbi:MAG: HEAT repeat domain-containing protein [Cyanobacteria bacterium P01_G01_bin.49]
MNSRQTLDLDNHFALRQFSSAIYDSQTQAVNTVELGLQILETGDFQQRWEVAKLFPKLGTQIIDPLLNILKNEAINLDCRWFICRILGEFNDTRVILALVNLLQTTEAEELSTIAAETLGKIGINTIDSLEQLLTNNHHKLLAVKALGQIRHSETILPLLRVVDDPDSNIRAIAIESLGSFHQADLMPLFINSLKDPVAVVRKEAIITLGMQPEFKEEFEVVEQLTPLLWDLNLEVSQQAALALGRIKDPVAIEALVTRLQSTFTPISLKQEIIKALNWIGNTQGLDALKQFLWQQEESLEIVQTIIILLGDQTTATLKKQATQILIDFLKLEKTIIKEKQIKQVIAASLGELGQAIAINALNILVKDSEKTVQLHAIAALKKISAP